MNPPRRGAWELLPARARELFGIELEPRHLQAFERHLQILERWSARMNLVATRTCDELVDRHLLDSLALARWARSARVTVDLGSGAGFPGVPLAVMFPAVRFHLIESRAKRSSFLRQVTRTLGLRNVEVWDGPAETWNRGDGVDLVIGRAIAVEDLAAFADRFLEARGRLIAMRKAGAAPLELDGFTSTDAISYRLPGGEHHRAIAFERST